VLIYKQLSSVMQKISSIEKSRKNSAQGYSFRGIDDVYNAIHEPLASCGVFTVPEVLEERSEERTNAKGTVLIYRILKVKITFFAEDGSSVSAVVIGEGMDTGDKASNKAMSVAHKYALLQVLCIPTEELKDPEVDHHEVTPGPATSYQGTNMHKQFLLGLMKTHNVPAKYGKDIHEVVIGKTMRAVEETVKNWEVEGAN
jgi:hypothetical protein